MAATITNPEIPFDVLAAMEEAARIALSNVRDPEVMRQASERMDRMREELRQTHGEMSIAVDLVRAIRE